MSSSRPPLHTRDDLDSSIGDTLRRTARLPARDANPVSDDELLRLLERAAPATELAATEAKIQRSPEALARLEILREVLSDSSEFSTASPQGEGVLSRARRVVFRFTERAVEFLSGDVTPELALGAAVRGEAAEASAGGAYQWLEPLGDIQAAFVLDRASNGTVDLSLKLLTGGRPLRGGRVTLNRNGTLYEVVDLASDGAARFRGLDPAGYQVEISPQAGQVQRVRIDLVTE